LDKRAFSAGSTGAIDALAIFDFAGTLDNAFAILIFLALIKMVVFSLVEISIEALAVCIKTLASVLSSGYDSLAVLILLGLLRKRAGSAGGTCFIDALGIIDFAGIGGLHLDGGGCTNESNKSTEFH
jgi:hypothetical protein